MQRSKQPKTWQYFNSDHYSVSQKLLVSFSPVNTAMCAPDCDVDLVTIDLTNHTINRHIQINKQYTCIYRKQTSFLEIKPFSTLLMSIEGCQLVSCYFPGRYILSTTDRFRSANSHIVHFIIKHQK